MIYIDDSLSSIKDLRKKRWKSIKESIYLPDIGSSSIVIHVRNMAIRREFNCSSGLFLLVISETEVTTHSMNHFMWHAANRNR